MSTAFLFCPYRDCQTIEPLPDHGGPFPGVCPKCQRMAKWLIVKGTVGNAFELNHNDRQFLKSIRVSAE